MKIHTIGIDLGKTVFHLIGVNAKGAWFARSVRECSCCALPRTLARA